MKSIIIALVAATNAIAIRSNSQDGVFKVDVKSFGGNTSSSCGNGQSASVEYTGKLPNGKVFDSTTKAGYTEPFDFVIGTGEVIPCWDSALA